MPARRYIAASALAVASIVGSSGDAAAAGAIRGVVFADADGDGRKSASEPPVAGVRVWLETRASAPTDAEGRFELTLSRRPGEMVWVGSPEGFSPTPTWRVIDEPATDDVEIELGLKPVAVSAPLTFVHVSDAHIGKTLFAAHGRIGAEDLRHALSQAIDLEPAPAFVVMTGDLTNRETKGEIREAARVLFDLGVPFVPVPGNHDWVSRGANYRPVFGPPSYTFDIGGVHFVVLNDNWKRPPDVAFLQRELATMSAAERERPIVALTHRPPEDHIIERLERLGVDTLLTGHWHANRYLEHGALRQLNVEPIVRGGIDFTPAGYRVMTIESGELTVVHRTVVESAQAELVWPPADGCVPPGPTTVLAAVQVSGREPDVRLATGGAEAVPMRAAGGWAYARDEVVLADGGELELIVSVGGREVARRARTVAVCAEAAAPVVVDWLQSQGGPEHHGAVQRSIDPPLRGLWATAVGGTVYGGSPAVGGGLVIVPLSDLATGAGGGVVALDADSGAIRWRREVGHSVRGTPAIVDGRVIFGSADGTLHAVSLDTGEPAWSFDLGESVDNNRGVLIAAPVIADGVVYAGVIGRFAALEAATGKLLWEDLDIAPTSKDLSTRASATVVGDLVVATAGLGRDGLVAWDRRTGERRWKLDKKITNGINGSPIALEQRLFVTNAAGELRAINIAGKVEWTRKVVAGGTGFSHSIAATPALAGQTLVVPSQYRSVQAVSTRGQPLWELAVEPGAVHAAHNARTSRAVTSSPIITGDIVWVAGLDGVLRAADLSTGELLWSMSLGAPLLAGPAPAGDLLIVAGFDGTVRALVHDVEGPTISRPGARSGVLFAIVLLACGLVGVIILRSRK